MSWPLVNTRWPRIMRKYSSSAAVLNFSTSPASSDVPQLSVAASCLLSSRVSSIIPPVSATMTLQPPLARAVWPLEAGLRCREIITSRVDKLLEQEENASEDLSGEL